MSTTQQQRTTFTPVQSVSEANELFSQAEHTLKQLDALLQQETDLAKSGKLRLAVQLQPEKARLTSEYIKSAERYRANISFLKETVPDATQRLATLHESFRNTVATNLNAMATAKALAESIVQEVIGAVQEHEKPDGYASSGTVPTGKAIQPRPLKLNREL